MMRRGAVARQNQHPNDGVTIRRRNAEFLAHLGNRQRHRTLFALEDDLHLCAAVGVDFHNVIADFLSAWSRLIAGMDQNVVCDLAQLA